VQYLRVLLELSVDTDTDTAQGAGWEAGQGGRLCVCRGREPRGEGNQLEEGEQMKDCQDCQDCFRGTRKLV